MTRYTFPFPYDADNKTHRIPGGAIDFLITSKKPSRDGIERGGDRDFQFSLPLPYEDAIMFAKAMLKMAKRMQYELEHGIGWRLATLEQMKKDIDAPDTMEKNVYTIKAEK
jgi:hypothetical protein